MPSDEASPTSHPPKPVKQKPSKAGSPGSEGPWGLPDKMARGGDAARKPHHPASEGEKDSGFSDVSSECLSAVEQTDTEDQSSDVLRQLAELQKAPQKALGGLAGGAFTGLAPVYIVKNIILKQPQGTSPSTQFLAWSSQHPLDGAEGSPARVLLIQQPVAPLKALLPGHKSSAKETYLPILSNYPKIAPHPGHDLQTKEGGGGGPAPAGGASTNKRFCLEEAWVSSSDPAAPADGGDQPPEERPSALLSLEALSQNMVSSSTGWDQAEGRMISKASKRLGCSSLGKQRRFHNTVEILRKSGLLGITLRTKELIRQNSSTQRELAELREHAQLLCEAVRSNDGQAWARLQQAMDRSAAYWGRKGAGSDAQPLGPRTPLVAEPAGPGPKAGREPLPSSPLTPDTSGQVVLP
ncbi:CLOCK-interacting pacemaker [Elgaria multicarinata webbii]|uniref:CLOCK-interacting pacemaker n=1 Tax=Elgaria multicarinata webbii TaxID=159646 RepID=UPI002FCD24DD